MRRAVLLAILASLLLTVAAIAAVPPAGSYFHATKSKHGHYAVQVLTVCLTTGCHKSKTVSTDVEVGKPGVTKGRCPAGTYAVPGKIKGSAFSGSGQFILRHKLMTISVTGKFVTKAKITGTVTGPKACGGADRFVAVSGALPG